MPKSDLWPTFTHSHSRAQTQKYKSCGPRIIKKSDFLITDCSHIHLLPLLLKRIVQHPSEKSNTQVSIVLIVPHHHRECVSLPPLPGHHQAYRLIRLIWVFSFSAGPLSFSFFFFFTTHNPLISLFTLMGLTWSSDPREKKIKTLFPQGFCSGSCFASSIWQQKILHIGVFYDRIK